MPEYTHAYSGPVVPLETAKFDEYMTARVKAMESILIERGVVSAEAVERIAHIYEHEVGPQIGAKVVARAWSEPDFKARLLTDATQACAEMGVSGLQGEAMIAVENTDEVHNVIVCTLCSCYPWPVLGLPPNWYKAAPYRSRAVREPRAVLAEFGADVPADREVRVWDSSSEVRYWVLPQRPTGTEGFSQEELAALVTRDSIIGVATLAPVTQGSDHG
jgi:nitrile hydratase